MEVIINRNHQNTAPLPSAGPIGLPWNTVWDATRLIRLTWSAMLAPGTIGENPGDQRRDDAQPTVPGRGTWSELARTLDAEEAPNADLDKRAA